MVAVEDVAIGGMSLLVVLVLFSERVTIIVQISSFLVSLGVLLVSGSLFTVSL